MNKIQSIVITCATEKNQQEAPFCLIDLPRTFGDLKFLAEIAEDILEVEILSKIEFRFDSLDQKKNVQVTMADGTPLIETANQIDEFISMFL